MCGRPATSGSRRGSSNSTPSGAGPIKRSSRSSENPFGPTERLRAGTSGGSSTETPGTGSHGCASSLRAQTVGWIETRGVERGHHRGDEANEHRGDAGDQEVERARFDGKPRDEIHLRVERERVDQEELAHHEAEEESERGAEPSD